MENKQMPKIDKIWQDSVLAERKVPVDKMPGPDSALVDHLKFQSKAHSEDLELIYLVKRQKKKSVCLFLQSGTLLVIASVFLIAAWLVSICPSLSDFAKVIFQSKFEINFDSVKDGKILERSVKFPTEILVLLAIFSWRFCHAAFLKKDSKSNSVENSSK